MTTLERLKPILEDLGAEGEIEPSTNLRDDLGFDSLDLTELALYTEDEFSIGDIEEAMPEIQTVGQLVALINRKLNE